MEEKITKTKMLLDQLQQGVQDLFTSEKYANFLRFMSRFHSYSANNCLLIMMQCPTASLVAPYSVWNDNGRQVKRGAHAIRILAPHTYKVEEDGKEVERLGFHAASVFDVSDTYSIKGTEIPSICDDLTDPVEDYDALCDVLIRISPVPVSFEPTADPSLHGYYSHDTRSIVIRSGMSESQTIKTMIHEITHAVMHSRDGMQPDADKRTREVEAESVAYVVSEYLGLDTSDYSFGYIAGWSASKELPELRRSLDIIRRVSDIIITRIEELISDGCTDAA